MQRILILFAVVTLAISGCVSFNQKTANPVVLPELLPNQLIEQSLPEGTSLVGVGGTTEDTFRLNGLQYQRLQYHAQVQIGQDDENRFMQDLKDNIESRIQSVASIQGRTIGEVGKVDGTGQGESISDFSLAYVHEGTHGFVYVWGIRCSSDLYRMIILVEEAQQL